MANHELDQLRKQVDEINLQLLHLLNKRGEIVQKIGEQKQVKTIRNINSSTYFQNNLQS